MALIFAQSAEGQTIDVPAGEHVGHVLLRYHDLTFQGQGRGVSRIRADGTYGTLFQAIFPPPATQNSEPQRRITLRDLTLDGAGLTALTSMLGGNTSAGPLEIVAERVDFEGFSRNTIGTSLGGVTATLRAVSYAGGGRAIVASSNASDILVAQATIRGGQGGFIVADGSTCENLEIRGFDCRPWYWASPTYEAVEVTAIGDAEIDVVSHVSSHRRLYDVVRILSPRGSWDVGDVAALQAMGARRWDRIEADDGRWTQVIYVDAVGRPRVDIWRAAGSWAPAGSPPTSALVYAMSLGRVYGWSTTQIRLWAGSAPGSVPPDPHWRQVDGTREPTPALVAGARVDIIRHGATGGPRDVDVGAIHLTGSTAGARLSRVFCEGGFSDQVTLRGSGHRLDGALIRFGQDMGITSEKNGDDDHEYERVVSDQSGFDGMYVVSGRPRVRRCMFRRNGTHANGYAGNGIQVNTGADLDVADVYFDGNYADEIRRL